MVTTMLAVALAAAPAVGLAQDAYGASGPAFHRFGAPDVQTVHRLLGWLGIYLELDLNERQLTEIEGILEAELPPISDLSDEMARARREFISSTEPDEFDADAVRRFAVTQAPLYVEMVTLTANLKAEVFGVLDPVQQVRLGELLGLIGPRRS
jgi:hypothetical protein